MANEKQTVYGVYRVLKNGQHRYVSRSVTMNEKLAQDIAAGLSRGEVVMPWGATKHVPAFPHIHKPIM
jgi:hypothetical protein